VADISSPVGKKPSNLSRWYNLGMKQNSKRKKYIVGNWKMNPQSVAEVKTLISGVKKAVFSSKKVDVIVCPPFVFLETVSRLITKVKINLGSQDISINEKGSYTSQISAGMVAGFGSKYTIIGHSERRKEGENDIVVNKKIAAALKTSLTPIVCVGEEVRDEHGEYLAFLEKQLQTVFSGISREDVSKMIIAYEPIWAIGKSEADAMKPHDIYETSLYIRKVLGKIYGMETAAIPPILYGGSVSGGIAPAILKDGNVDGLLIGRQSLVAADFVSVIKTANEL